MTRFNVWVAPGTRKQRLRIWATKSNRNLHTGQAHKFGRRKYYLSSKCYSKKDAYHEAKLNRAYGWHSRVVKSK